MPQDRSKGFTKVPNYLIDDTRLSLAAKGLMDYFLSHSPDFKPNMTDIQNRCSEKTKAIRTILKELRQKGYVLREEGRNSLGHPDYTYKASPKPKREWANEYLKQEPIEKSRGKGSKGRKPVNALKPKEVDSLPGALQGNPAENITGCLKPGALNGQSAQGTDKHNMFILTKNTTTKDNSLAPLQSLPAPTPPGVPTATSALLVENKDSASLSAAPSPLEEAAAMPTAPLETLSTSGVVTQIRPQPEKVTPTQAWDLIDEATRACKALEIFFRGNLLVDELIEEEEEQEEYYPIEEWDDENEEEYEDYEYA